MMYLASIGQSILELGVFQFMTQLKKNWQEVNKVQERVKWDYAHLPRVAYIKACAFCIFDIYLTYYEEPHLFATETENRIISLMNQRNSAKVKKIFEEVIECIDGMFAADMLALKLPSSFINLELAPPVYCVRPVDSNDKLKALELYDKLAKMKPVMTEVEEFHIKAASLLQKNMIVIDNSPISDLICKVVQQKVSEIYSQTYFENSDKHLE